MRDPKHTRPGEPFIIDDDDGTMAAPWLVEMMTEQGEAGVTRLRELLRARGLDPDQPCALGLAAGIAHLSWRLATRLAVGDDPQAWNEAAKQGAAVAAVCTPPKAEVQAAIDARGTPFLDGDTIAPYADQPRAAGIAARSVMAQALRDAAEITADRLGLDRTEACGVVLDGLGALAATLLADWSTDPATLEANLAATHESIARNARATFMQSHTGARQ